MSPTIHQGRELCWLGGGLFGDVCLCVWLELGFNSIFILTYDISSTLFSKVVLQPM